MSEALTKKEKKEAAGITIGRIRGSIKNGDLKRTSALFEKLVDDIERLVPIEKIVL